MVVEEYLVPREPTPDACSPCPAAPSVEYNGNQKQMEEGGSKDDISGVVTRETKECVVNKKSLRCTAHDCDVRSMSVTTKKWQWNERKKQYMNVSRKVKKYVCLYVSGCQVQPMLKSVEGLERTMPGVGKQLEVSEVNQHDYDRTEVESLNVFCFYNTVVRP